MLNGVSPSVRSESVASKSKADRDLSIAVVGCGYWGSKHVRVLSGLNRVRELVVFDPQSAIVKTIQSAFPAVKVATDLNDALAMVDAAVIATPIESHVRLAEKALRHGKHVLVEKPLATSVDEGNRLMIEAQRLNRILMVGHTFLFNPAVKELKKRLDSGDLGSIRYVYSARLNLGLYRPDVNVVWDLAPHDISIMNFLLNSLPTRVTAWSEAVAGADMQDVAVVRLHYEGIGISTYIHVSWLDPRKVRTITVVGSRKMAIYDDVSEERLRIYDRGLMHVDNESAQYAFPLGYHYGDIITPCIPASEPLMVEDSHFVDAVLNGSTPESDGMNGLAVVAVLEAIEYSIRAKKSVYVDYPQILYEGSTAHAHAWVG